MLIREILALETDQPNSHPDILGDPFLMLHNPVYRQVKTQALRMGCQYREAWPEYLLLPFFQLKKIVASKTIPYVPNARLARELEQEKPGLLNLQNFNVPESYHLHESAHVIADALFAQVPLGGAEERILKALSCESFANTVDALVFLAADSETHQNLVQLSSYMRPDPEDIAVLSRLHRELGSRATFLLTFFAYLSANFLGDGFSEESVNSIATLYLGGEKLSARQKEDALQIGQMAEKLDPLFRVQTTEVYFKFEGIEGDLHDVLNFSFMRMFNARPDLAKIPEQMAAVLNPVRPA